MAPTRRETAGHRRDSIAWFFVCTLYVYAACRIEALSKWLAKTISRWARYALAPHFHENIVIQLMISSVKERRKRLRLNLVCWRRVAR